MSAVPERLDAWREAYLNEERSKKQLQKDLVVAFDRIAELQAMNRNLLKIVGASIGATATLTVALLKLIEYFTQ